MEMSHPEKRKCDRENVSAFNLQLILRDNWIGHDNLINFPKKSEIFI
jgi:hypothetical protein